MRVGKNGPKKLLYWVTISSVIVHFGISSSIDLRVDRPYPHSVKGSRVCGRQRVLIAQSAGDLLAASVAAYEPALAASITAIRSWIAAARALSSWNR